MAHPADSTFPGSETYPGFAARPFSLPYPYDLLYPGQDIWPGHAPSPTPRSAGVVVPHFALPFRVSRGAAVAVEQDTTDDVLSCVLAILLCPVGYRVELPEFGLDDPTFAEGEPDTDAIASALARWEPRADSAIDANPDVLDELISNVSLLLGTRSTD